MIHKQYSKFSIQCDNCDDIETEPSTTFAEAVQTAKEIGWLITKDDDDDWVHFCPSCVKLLPKL